MAFSYGYKRNAPTPNGAAPNAASAGAARTYGMGRGARPQAASQPVPDPYQQGYGDQVRADHANRAYGDQVYADPRAAQQRHYAAPALGATAAAASYGQPSRQPGYAHYAAAYGAGCARMSQQAYVTPATSVPQQMPKKKRGPLFWIGIVAAILCVILACVLALVMCNGQSKRMGEAGQLEGKTDAEIQAELDRQVEEGMFNISIASTVQFETGTSEGEFRIENVPNNPYLMQVSISRDDTGEEIYSTDMIEPDHHIQRDTLDVDLDPGTYECTATFFACDQQTEDVIGQAAAKVLVIVTG